jgi:tripartite-type tricarboxylate transporter receptor subunit TctC
MLPSRRNALQLAGSFMFSALASKTAWALTYPDSPVSIVVPLPAGAVIDILARLATDRFQKDLKQPFIVENVPGGVSNIGAARVAHAPPDGRTVLLTVNSPIAVNQFLYKNMTFDPERDLSPVILTSSTPLALVVHPSFPAKNVSDYLDYARAHPGEVTYGSSGIGSTPHLCAEYLSSLTGLKLLHVPYKGTPETITDLIAGNIRSAILGVGLVTELAKSGQMRILAVTEDNRLADAPDIPTIQETVPQFVHAPGAWHGMYVPSRTPPEIIDILNKEMNVVLQDPNVVGQLRKNYIFPIGGPPQALEDRGRLERTVTGALIQRIGIAPQ